MKRVVFFCFIILSTVVVYASNIDKKINKSQKHLTDAQKQQKQMNQQLNKIAKSIRRIEKESIKIDQILDKLKYDQSITENEYLKAQNMEREIEHKLRVIDKEIQKRESNFVNLLSNQFSTIVAMKAMNRTTQKSIVLSEVYKAYSQNNNQKLKRLKNILDKSKKEKARMLKSREELKKSIATIEKKRKLYKKKKKEKQELLKKLATDEKIYRKRLQALITRQNMLRLTLAKLNILKKEEIEEAKRREAQRQAELKRQAQRLAKLRKEKEAQRAKAIKEGKKVDYTAVSLKSDIKSVKQYGSSYHKDRIYKYKGPKTISPIEGAKLVKKFGTYVDPIYKIKIFNESITLEAPVENAKVRNVLNGKVVYMGKNSMLGRVVIVAHSGKLHTVYAGLSKISPLIRKDLRIKKGTIIGKVKHKLIFEATKNSKYINPLNLIRL